MSFFLVLFTLLSFTFGNRCINSVGVGEADIVNGNVAGAKQEALLRAKWDAIEKALGVYTDVKTIVENFKLLDEVITNKIKGFIRDVKVLNEEVYSDIVRVKVKGCVYPESAEKALSLLSSETAFVVIFVPDKPPVDALTSEVVRSLIEQGYKVYDISSVGVSPIQVERALRNNNYVFLRKLLLKSLASAMIYGKVNFYLQTGKGQDIGYGISSPFYVVRATGIYYLIASENGKARILYSGSAEATGRGLNEEFAKNDAIKNLSEELRSKILESIEEYREVKRKRVRLIVEGNNDTESLFELRQILQKIPWVEEVKIKGKGLMEVTYSDNVVYLVYALEKNPYVEVKDYTPFEVKIIYGE